jgi:hypothetical protein
MREVLAELKKGAVAHLGDTIRMVKNTSPAFISLASWVNRLRKVGEIEYRAILADKGRHSGSM